MTRPPPFVFILLDGKPGPEWFWKEKLRSVKKLIHHKKQEENRIKSRGSKNNRRRRREGRGPPGATINAFTLVKQIKVITSFKPPHPIILMESIPLDYKTVGQTLWRPSHPKNFIPLGQNPPPSSVNNPNALEWDHESFFWTMVAVLAAEQKTRLFKRNTYIKPLSRMYEFRPNNEREQFIDETSFGFDDSKKEVAGNSELLELVEWVAELGEVYKQKRKEVRGFEYMMTRTRDRKLERLGKGNNKEKIKIPKAVFWKTLGLIPSASE